jgi:dihydroorotase-like cyclic amidohydrolase
MGEMAGTMGVDYSLHLALQGKLNPALLSELGDVIGLGIPSVKIFLIYYNWWGGDGGLYNMFRETARHGGMGVVHCENTDIWEWESSRLIAEGKKSGK